MRRRSSRNNNGDTVMKSTDSRTNRMRSLDNSSRFGSQTLMQDEPQIKLGTTRLSDYSKLGMLGKGTYGEVHKCVHNATGQIVAMKTYFFENVS